MNVLLAVVDLNKTSVKDLILEGIALAQAINLNVKDTMIQKANSINSTYAFRKGKLLELKNRVKELEIDEVIFLNNLSINILSNISEYVECKVIDRTTLILDIFALRAKTKEAIIQVELARLKYDLPKLTKDFKDNEHQRGGGAINRGSGQMRSNIIKNTARKRIKDLEDELINIENKRLIHAKKRNLSNIKKVALVGYTNVGKSSLMNVLLDNENKEVYSEDMLFATVDTDIRLIKYQNYEFLLFDTVGFIYDLPHTLVEAFKSTLESIKEADLILNVIDISNDNYLRQKDTTYQILKEIKADNIKIIDVYNKVDLLENIDLNKNMISCKEKTGINNLLHIIIDNLYPKDFKVVGVINYQDIKIINRYQNIASIKILNYVDNGIEIEVSATKNIFEKISKYFI